MYSEAFCIFIVKTFFNEEKTFEETELVIYFNRKKEKFKVVLAFFYLVSLRPIFYIPLPAESSLLDEKNMPFVTIKYYISPLRNEKSLWKFKFSLYFFAKLLWKLFNSNNNIEDYKYRGLSLSVEVRGWLKIYQDLPGLYHCIYTLIDSPCLNCKPAGQCPL